MENKELIETYEEYIALLGKALNDNIAFLHIHGINASSEDIKKGEELRAKIKELKSQVEK